MLYTYPYHLMKTQEKLRKEFLFQVQRNNTGHQIAPSLLLGPALYVRQLMCLTQNTEDVTAPIPREGLGQPEPSFTKKGQVNLQCPCPQTSPSPLRNLGPMNVSKKGNTNSVTHFILLDFPSSPERQLLYFGLFSVAYTLTLMGNAAIACAVRGDCCLHTPMYIFLGNFSLLEICYITTTVPNLLANLLSTTKSISFVSCFAQFYFFFSFGCDEGFYLCILAFDRYPICRPLHYPRIMARQLCTGLVALGWSCGFIIFLTPVVFISQLPYCGPNIINHFMCDPVPIMMLSCSEDTTTQFIYSTFNAIFMIGTFLFILYSYALVILAVLQMPSAASKGKAFSTCASHLAVVFLFFGSIMVMYVNPGSRHPVEVQKIMTLFYSVITPLLNPLIYSLRNKEMKAALRKVFWAEILFIKHK
ncbi:LOW QUALITY PROTEIN: olfactory receptor 11H6-like [Erethizon dorsatum]